MITIDDREAAEAQEHHHIFIPSVLGGIPCVIQRLEAGDYAFLDRDSNPLGIERCEIGNLIQKLRSGELETQLLHCQESYTSIILLVEGVYDKADGWLAVHKGGERGYFRAHIYPQTPYEYVKALEVRLSELGIEVLSAPNFSCSLALVKTIYDQRTKPEEEHTLFKETRTIRIPTRWTNNPAVPRLMALVPRLSEKVATQLIQKYGSIWAILHTDEKELLEIRGVGKGTLKKLKEGIGKP